MSGTLRDLWAIVRYGRGAPHALLRREYDRLYPVLRPLAAGYRRRIIPHTRVVAVIGSLGKSTATALVRAGLDVAPHHFSFSNYGASLARNVMRLRPGERHAVLEVGVSGPGRMAEYGRMLRPDIVVVTSIASEHNRSFLTLEATRKEKVEMVRALHSTGLAILNGDDANVRWMATQTAANILTVGIGEHNDLRATDITVADDGATTFTLHLAGREYRVRSPLLGRHLTYPLLAVAAVAHAEGLDVAAALARASAVAPQPSRMEIVDLPDGTRIVDDSFKGAVESMVAAFDAVATMPGRRRLVVLGPVEEPTGPQGELYRDLGRQLAAFADVVICVGGKAMSGVRTGAAAAGMDPSRIHLAESRADHAMQLLDQLRLPGDLILVKGASALRLGRIVERLKGRTVSCRVRLCRVKVNSCGTCPLLDAPEALFDNRFVRRSTTR